MVCTIGLSARAATGDTAIAHSTLTAIARSRLVVMESPRLPGGARGAVENEQGRPGGVAGHQGCTRSGFDHDNLRAASRLFGSRAGAGIGSGRGLQRYGGTTHD